MPNFSLRDKFALMSNRELTEYLEHPTTTDPDALDIASKEAHSRHLEINKTAPVEEKQLVVTKVDLDPDDQWGKSQQVEDESAPLLYSKRAIYTFSFLFSVLFGGVLIVLNLRVLKKPEGVVPTLSFSIAYLATVALVLGFLESRFNINPSNGYLVSYIGAWLILKMVWDKYIGEEIKYRKRKLLIPAIIAITIFAAYVFTMVSFGAGH